MMYNTFSTKNKVRLLALNGLMLALGVLLPQVCHLTGVPNAGNILLPMHLSVYLSGMLLGPASGMLTGLLVPIISFLLTGMPPVARLPFMILELMTYGCVGGWLIRAFAHYKRPFDLYLPLILTMLSGRVVYALSLAFATYLLHIPCGGIYAAVEATIVGALGIVIQLVMLPPIIAAVKR